MANAILNHSFDEEEVKVESWKIKRCHDKTFTKQQQCNRQPNENQKDRIENIGQKKVVARSTTITRSITAM